MSWKKERDSLIAQTMAFVQSVTGRIEGRNETSGLNGAAAPVPMPPQPDLALRPPKAITPVEPIRIADAPPAAMAAGPQRPIVPGELASEIRARVASFRAHQERFNREREQYFSATLQRLRAAIDEAKAPRIDE